MRRTITTRSSESVRVAEQEARYVARTQQLDDEREHEKQVQANVQALLKDKLSALRTIKDQMQADQWKYESNERPNETNPNVSQQF